jgi:poly(3-hydroxybutyrate) depolymerase
MRLSVLVVVALAISLPPCPARAADAKPAGAVVTVITKDGRHTGTLPVTQIEVKTDARVVKVPLSDIASLQFGDAADVIRNRQGKAVKGQVKIDGWTLQEKDAALPLARGDLRFVIPQAMLPTPPRRGAIVHATTANGMTYHVRLPDKYDANVGAPAIVMLHGSNANSADYLLGISQRWPKIAADYALIGIDGEWPNATEADGQPSFNYTYINFVGKSKYKGFPGSDRESPALVAEAVAEIRQQIKLTKVFVTGHSQGGFLTYSLLMNYPDVFDGAMPIAAGLIFQCEPGAYEDASIRRLQRQRPLVILHGDRDPLVAVSMGRAAYGSFLEGGFPMLRLSVTKGAAHAFIGLPFEEGIRWLESMTSDDPRKLLASAQQAFAGKEYRDALAYLQRAQELDTAGAQSSAIKTLRQKIEQQAAVPAKSLEAAMAKPDGGNAWVADFDAFRQQFEFTDAAATAMAEYAKLRKQHEAPAEKLWAKTRKAFQDGDKEQGYKTCEEIVSKYYASTYYRYAKQTLDERGSESQAKKIR